MGARTVIDAVFGLTDTGDVDPTAARAAAAATRIGDRTAATDLMASVHALSNAINPAPAGLTHKQIGARLLTCSRRLPRR